MVTFELFVRPAIRLMAGHTLPYRRSVPVQLTESVSLKPRLQHFLRGIVSDGPNGPQARLTGPQGSGILTSMVLANALLVIPEGQFETTAGSIVQALRLDDPVHQADPAF
jgi:molybdopterin molybdotransferase